MKVGVLASGEGTNLQALLDSLHGREIEVVAVACDQPSARALERAQAAGVPSRVFLRSEFGARAARDAAMGDWLAEQGVELVVLAGYMAILDAGFVARFPDRILNVHPSLLPAFPGVRAVEQAVEHGVKVFGVTIHLVDEGVDTGPIVLQRAIELPDARDPAAVRASLRPIEHELLPARRRTDGGGAPASRRRPPPPRADRRGAGLLVLVLLVLVRLGIVEAGGVLPAGVVVGVRPVARGVLTRVGLLAARLRLLASVVDVVVEVARCAPRARRPLRSSSRSGSVVVRCSML